MDRKIPYPYFYTFNQYLKDTYPYKVFKIPIDAGFSCPNRDGTKGSGGCTYCDNASFSPAVRGPQIPYLEQIQRGINFYREKRKARKFIVYFQAYSNTHRPVQELKVLYDQALQVPDVIGLSIGTRPDCVDEEKLDLLASYRDQGYYLWLELGLESMHNQTLERINRLDTFENFLKVVEKAQQRKLNICTHLILGLPGETYEMMMQTAKTMAELKLQGCKMHHLYIAPETVMFEQYQRGEIKVMDFDEYLTLACDFLEYLPPQMVIHRFIGELYGQHSIAPNWKMIKSKVIERFAQEFLRRGTEQGSRNPENHIFSPTLSSPVNK